MAAHQFGDSVKMIFVAKPARAMHSFFKRLLFSEAQPPVKQLGSNWLVPADDAIDGCALIYPKESATPEELQELGRLLAEWSSSRGWVSKIVGLEELRAGELPPAWSLANNLYRHAMDVI